MNKPNVERVRELFGQLLELPHERREDLLRDSCGDDTAMRAELESLLQNFEQAERGFLPLPKPRSTRSGQADRQLFESLIGHMVGAYRIESLMAVGGMGAVYRAQQTSPSRPVAIKVMKHTLGSETAQRRFEFEVEILGRLRHPNIAQIYEAGLFEDGEGLLGSAGSIRPYFSMELVPAAVPITQHVEERHLGLEAKLEIFSVVCHAVHAAHQRGVIHRDIKPANILVDEAGRPKLIDFGVARDVAPDDEDTRVTETGQFIGTMQYMAPEQCSAPYDIDTRTDVYSLGIVLYELLSGALPYRASGSDLIEAVQAIRDTPPTPIHVHGKELGGAIAAVVCKAMEKDPARRYASPPHWPTTSAAT